MSNLLTNVKPNSDNAKANSKQSEHPEVVVKNGSSNNNNHKTLSRSRTNIDNEDDKDLATIKAEIDKMRQNDVVVFDENTKQHIRDILHKNSDKFVKRGSVVSISSASSKASNTQQLLTNPQPSNSPGFPLLNKIDPTAGTVGIAGLRSKTKSVFAGNNKHIPAAQEAEEVSALSKKTLSDETKNTTQYSNNRGLDDSEKKGADPDPQKSAVVIGNPFLKMLANRNNGAVANNSTRVEPEATTKKPDTEKVAVKKLPVSGMGGGGFGKGLLARLREVAAQEKAAEQEKPPEEDRSGVMNISEINSSKQGLINPIAPVIELSAKESVSDKDGKGRKSTFAKLIGKLGPKKPENPAESDMKRANSIKQKLLDEEIELIEFDENFSNNKMSRFKQRAHLVVNHPECSRWATGYVLMTLLVILTDIFLIIAETEPSLNQPYLWVKYTRYLWPIYFIDFMIRVLIYNAFGETLWEFITKMNIAVDLLALIYTAAEIIWYFIGDYEAFPTLLKIMRVFVVGRLVRGFKLPIFNKGVDILQQGLKKSQKPLGILAFFAVLSLLAISSLVYFADSVSLGSDDGNHEVGNLPKALWWAIITVTTVGYGDTVPQSIAGKIIASFSLLFGVLLLSLPVAIIGNQFQEQYLKDLQLNTQKERKMAIQNMQRIESREEKDIYKMIVKLNELEEVNEKIEMLLKENQFLYRSITRDALSLINKIEMSNRQLHEVKSKETKVKEILKQIRKRIHERRIKKTKS